MLDNFLNNIKIPSLPPLLVKGEIVSTILKKPELFNKFFASQCSPVNNYSTLQPFKLRTDMVIDKVYFSNNNITHIVKKLNLNKLHDWKNISIRMIEIYDDFLFFKRCF